MVKELILQSNGCSACQLGGNNMPLELQVVIHCRDVFPILFNVGLEHLLSSAIRIQVSQAMVKGYLRKQTAKINLLTIKNIST